MQKDVEEIMQIDSSSLAMVEMKKKLLSNEKNNRKFS